MTIITNNEVIQLSDELLKSYLEVLPALKYIIQEDVMTSVTNKTHFLGYFPGDKMKMDLKVGAEIPKGDPLYKTITEKKVISTIVPKEVYGFPFKAVTYPIIDKKGEVVGAVGFAKSLENQYLIESTSETIFSALEETNASIQEVSSGSINLAATINRIVESANNTQKNIEEIDGITNLIRNISSQSNLLGLNAAIEAARAGEQGKGFAVVADEMRKLAALSSESAKKVSQTLSEMKKSIELITRQIKDTNSIAEGQSNATGQITAALEEITTNAEKLVNIARLI